MARKNDFILGIILVVMGGGFLLKELGIFVDFSFRYLWPIALILFGGVIIYNNLKS